MVLAKILLALYTVKQLKAKNFLTKTKLYNAKITNRSHAYKGDMSTYNVEILNSFNHELQLKDTESAIKNILIDSLSELRGFTFVTTLVLEFMKIESDDETTYSTFYSNLKAETFNNESDIDDVFESIYITIISNIQNSLGKGSGWMIDSVIDHTVNISRHNPLAGSCYIKLPKKIRPPKKSVD